MTVVAAGGVDAAPDDVVGEAFGRPVTEREFAYHLKTTSVFTRSGSAQRTEDATRQEAWQDLIFIQEAARLGITVSGDELSAELRRLMGEQGVEYPGVKYAGWVQSAMQEDVPTFERRVRDLLTINKLNKLKADPDVTVSEEEMRERFFNQYNSFESEYIGFGSPEEAEAFAQQAAQRPALWKETFDRKRAELGQKGAAWINVMALEALMDLWKIPKEDAYRIHSYEEGELVVGRYYYGTAVFRLLSKQSVSDADFTEEKREYYRKMLTSSKKYQAAKGYLDDLVKRAAYRDYVQERKQAEEQERQKVRSVEMKRKSSIVLETTQGRVELRLWPEVAPKACENFIKLVEKGYYNDLTFHRVKKDFMIQGGDPTGTGAGGESVWGKPFEDEVKPDVLFNRPGLLAMANAGPGTNGSQFFITTVPTPWLSGKHTIFGEVVSGLEAVKAIEGVQTDGSDKPLEPQKILSASIQAQD
jgi:peptidylprolyl isomerase